MEEITGRIIVVPDATGEYFPGDEPQTYCDLHKTITICAESEKKAPPYCPEARTVSMLDLTRLFPVSVSVSDQYRCFTGDNLPIGTGEVVSGGSSANYQQECEIHDENYDPEAGETETTGSESNGWPWNNMFGPGDNSDPDGPNTGTSSGGNSGTTGSSTGTPGGTTSTPEPSQPVLPSDPFDPEWWG